MVNLPNFIFSNEYLREIIRRFFLSEEARAYVIREFGEMGTWNVSEVTDMSYLFDGNTEMNENISEWDVSSVGTFECMFRGALRYNQPVDTWLVLNGSNFISMFENAISFNQPLWEDWPQDDVLAHRMFYNARSFNQSIEGMTDKIMELTQYGVLVNAVSFSQSLEFLMDASITFATAGWVWLNGNEVNATYLSNELEQTILSLFCEREEDRLTIGLLNFQRYITRLEELQPGQANTLRNWIYHTQNTIRNAREARFRVAMDSEMWNQLPNDRGGVRQNIREFIGSSVQHLMNR